MHNSGSDVNSRGCAIFEIKERFSIGTCMSFRTDDNSFCVDH